MIASLLVAGSLLGAFAPSLRPSDEDKAGFRTEALRDYSPSSVGLSLQIGTGPLQPPKLSPQKFPPKNQPFEFDFASVGLVNLEGGQPRFRVFSQERKVHEGLALEANRLLLRLWQYNYERLKLDHRPDYNRRMVDVYLCWGGVPGGEQMFAPDPQLDRAGGKLANTIYIYDLPSLKDPVEKVREVAHEYGHASIPGMSGFDTPESWANGYLGESLFLTWLSRDLKAGKLLPNEVMGVDLAKLNQWLARRADPLWQSAAQSYPASARFAPEKDGSMDRYIGQVLWMEQILPLRIFARSLKTVGSTNAADYPAAVVRAMEGEEAFEITIPTPLLGKSLWIPTGSLRLTGATPTQKKSGWALIKPTRAKLTLTP